MFIYSKPSSSYALRSYNILHLVVKFKFYCPSLAGIYCRMTWSCESQFCFFFFFKFYPKDCQCETSSWEKKSIIFFFFYHEHCLFLVKMQEMLSVTVCVWQRLKSMWSHDCVLFSCYLRWHRLWQHFSISSTHTDHLSLFNGLFLSPSPYPCLSLIPSLCHPPTLPTHTHTALGSRHLALTHTFV